MQFAEFYGLSQLQEIAASDSRSEIEESLLTGIQWYGDACQELIPLSGFAKYYISAEASSKMQDESAKAFLPRRLSVLIASWDKVNQRKLEQDIGEFIDERNAVFHAGRPQSQTVEYLHWFARFIASGTLNRIRQQIHAEMWETKNDFEEWASRQYSEFLN